MQKQKPKSTPKTDREHKDEVTPSDPLLRKQPEVREPEKKKEVPIKL